MTVFSNRRSILACVLTAVWAVRAASLSPLLSGSYSFGSSINLRWTVAGPNITFSMTCFPDTSKGPLSWCAFGINTAGTDKMYPAECWWAGLDAAGAPYLEDRITAKDAIPPCAPTQLSFLTASIATSSSLVVNFTRPLVVSSGLASQGYTSITGSNVEVIAAIGTGPRQSASCGMVESEHYDKFHKIRINFME